VRYKELWGDQGAESDALTINGTGVLNPATAPIDKRVIGMFAFDSGSDGVSNVTVPHPVFFSLPFLSGVDLFLPAAAPPKGNVSVALRSRGAGSHARGQRAELRLERGFGDGQPERLRVHPGSLGALGRR